MVKNYVKILRPTFYDEFKCKANKCKVTCCTGKWKIFVSRQNYSKVKNAVEKSKLNVTDYMKRNRDSEDDRTYATLCFTEDNKCKFLNENGFCSLQINCGYNVLPNICKEYPRNQIINNGTVFQSLSPTCEAVNEWIVKLKDGFDFIVDEKSGSELWAKQYTAVKIGNAVSTSADFFSVYSTLVDILQNRNFSIEERMMLLGMAFKNLDFNLVEEEFNYKSWAEKYEIFAGDYDAGSLFDNINPKEHRFVLNMLDMINSINLKTDKTNTIVKILSRLGFEKGARFNDNGEEESILRYDEEKYRDKKDKFNKIFADKQHIWENYLIMVFTDIIAGKNNLFDVYATMCYSFGIAKLYLIANVDELDSEEGIVDTLSAISRVTLHGELMKTFAEWHNEMNDRSLGSVVNVIYH